MKLVNNQPDQLKGENTYMANLDQVAIPIQSLGKGAGFASRDTQRVDSIRGTASLLAGRDGRRNNSGGQEGNEGELELHVDKRLDVVGQRSDLIAEKMNE